MAEQPKRCPKCHIEWGVREHKPARSAEGDQPAQPARYACEACYHRWDGED